MPEVLNAIFRDKDLVFVLENDIMDDTYSDDVKYNFRSFYEKAKFAISDSMKVCLFSENKSDRIRKWLTKKKRLNKGRNIANIIYKYYATKQKLEYEETDDIDDISETIKKIDVEIRNGADLNYCDRAGNTPFNYSIFVGENELIRYLLQFEFNVDHKNKHGYNSLVMAMKYDVKESICCILAERLKSPNIPDNDNVIAMVHALNFNYFKVMDVLSKKDCTEYRNWIISLCMKDQEIILCDIIKDNGVIFDTKLDEIGRTILHYAVLHKSFRIIRTILKNKYIYVDVVDNHGWSSLHYAAAKGYTQIISILTRYNADIFLKTDENFTPIDIATKFKKTDAILILNQIEIEKKEEGSHKHKLSISSLSDHDDSDNYYHPIAPKLTLSPSSSNILNLYNSDQESDDDWNKENLLIQNRNSKGSDSQSITNPSSNSENKATFKQIMMYSKPPSISKIDEDSYYEYNDQSCSSYDACSKSDSTRTRITHNSFSDQLERALIAL